VDRKGTPSLVALSGTNDMEADILLLSLTRTGELIRFELRILGSAIIIVWLR